MKLYDEEIYNAFKSALTEDLVLSNPQNIIVHRAKVLRFIVRKREILIGWGEGIVKDEEIGVFKRLKKMLEGLNKEISKDELEEIKVKGIKYIKERRVYGMLQGLIPVNGDVVLYYFRRDNVIFPLHKFLSLNLGSQRRIEIVSPKNLIHEVIEAHHPVFKNEKYKKPVEGVEVNMRTLLKGFSSTIGIGAIEKQYMLQDNLKVVYLIGDEDLDFILKSLVGDKYVN